MSATGDLSRGPVLLSISTGTASFAFATVVVRFCIRTRLSFNVGYDDYAIGVASFAAFIATILSILEGATQDPARALMFDYLGQPWFIMGATVAKISICLFFIRLVGNVKQWMYLLCAQIVLMGIMNLAFAITTNVQCRPTYKLWDLAAEGDCWDPVIPVNIGIAQGSFSVFWWLFLSLFPVIIVRDLDMHRRMKWPFYFLSSLTLVAGIFATVRTYEASQTVRGAYTFDTFFSAVLAALEQNIGLVAANVLPMGPLFSRHARRADRTLASARSLARSSTNKAPSLLIIQGARESYVDPEAEAESEAEAEREREREREIERRENARSGSRLGLSGGMGSRQGHRGRRGGSRVLEPEEADWPRGIIKTVEVEVVEEDITDLDRLQLPDRGASRMSTMSLQDSDWLAVLRAGPSQSPPASRGPSRQA